MFTLHCIALHCFFVIDVETIAVPLYKRVLAESRLVKPGKQAIPPRDGRRSALRVNRALRKPLVCALGTFLLLLYAVGGHLMITARVSLLWS